MMAFLLHGVGILSANSKDYPNIVVIMSDDQGWGDLSISGNSNLETPNIDRLAEMGITFDRFYVSPVCSPTRAELLTGRYHPRGGVYSTSTGGERLDLDEETIADFFRKAGYVTAAYGKWHNGMQPPYHPNSRGFDDFYGFCSGHWGNYFNPMLEHNGKIVKGNGYTINDFTERGIEFIERNKDRNFFLYLPYNTPHGPMQVPDKWWNRFERKELQMRYKEPEKENISFTRAALAMCENIDWNVGRIVSKIEELGLSDNTIIIYLSDNGPNSWRWNDGMKGRKGSTDEGGVRSPMFIKWKGELPAGKKVAEIASVIDLLPTLVDLAGIEFRPTKPLDGISLKPLLEEENPEWKERLIFNYWNGKTSVRGQRFRMDYQGQIFDMEMDPGQTKNISAELPEVKKRLDSAKREWELEVLSELSEQEHRPFTVGHPDFSYTQIPARDGITHGNIHRSASSPNCTYFTNWKSISDSITWEIEILSEGDFLVEIYYTCPLEDVGATFELSFAQEKVMGKIVEAYNPPLKGMEYDRVKRTQSYVKDFKSLEIGAIHLEKGKGLLTLKAKEIPGSQVMDFRLLMLKKKQ